MKVSRPPGEKSRFVVAWILLLALVGALAAVAAYNASAVAMLLGRGRVSLNSYSDASLQIRTSPQIFSSVAQTGNEQTGSLHYIAGDGAVEAVVSGQNDTIIQITAALDTSKLTELNVWETYKLTDSCIRPLCSSSDVLAAEIGILKLAAQMTVSGLSGGQTAVSRQGTRVQTQWDGSLLTVLVTPEE